jgi:RND family efflux transporter MFP subunit
MKTSIYLIFVSLLVLSCGKKEEAVKAPVVRPIKMVKLQIGGLQKIFEYPGVIQPSLHADLAFEVNGKIISVNVKEGDEVKAGAVVASLDPRDYKSSLDASKARLEETQQDAIRYKRLFKQKATSEESMEKAIRAEKTAQANFEQATKAYEDTFLRAPFAGTIARVLVSDFQTVQAKQDIMILQDTTLLEAVIDIPETLWAKGTHGMTNEERTRIGNPLVQLTSLPGSSFRARISELGMQADPSTRTFPVTFVFTVPSNLNVSPGMTAKVILTAPRNFGSDSPGFVVPVESVVHDNQGEAYVWQIDPIKMKASKVPVKAGEMEGNHLEIRGNLKDGDLIASSGVQQLREGVVVKKWQ